MKIYPGRAPEYRLKQAHNEIPAGAHINPVRFEYLPREVQEKFQYLNQKKEWVCWTAKGYMLIPLNFIDGM